MKEDTPITYELAGSSKPNLDTVQIKAEKRAIWVYHWLFLSPLITVPAMAIYLYSLDYHAGVMLWFIAVLAPALVHLIMLRGLSSPHLFVRRHTQQGFILLGLRVCSALLFISLMRGSFCLWLPTSALLWAGGSLLGWTQVRRGDCWLMRRKDEGGELPRPWAINGWKVPVRRAASSSSVSTARPIPTTSDQPKPAVNAGQCWASFNQAENLADNLQDEEAAVAYLFVFRHGPPDLQQKAAAALDRIGEVETF